MDTKPRTTTLPPSALLIPPLPPSSPSIMEAFTQFNPRVCITEDDLEALNTLYPDCSHALSAPVCFKSDHNIGWVRLAVWLGTPGTRLAHTAPSAHPRFSPPARPSPRLQASR